MGTSTARQAPGGKFWRTAKTTMARFASGKEASPPGVSEVVARYVTALQVDSGDTLEATAFLPAMVRTAASLENFYQCWQRDGWEAALTSLGESRANYFQPEEIMSALLDRLAGPGDTLAAAVTRAALGDHLDAVLSSASDPAAPAADSDDAAIVSIFLALALHRKLLSDLGETLEFHAPTVARGLDRQEEIRAYLLTEIRALPPAGPAAPWTGDHAPAFLNNLLTLLAKPHVR
jgi:hypothetical protein